SSAFNSVWTWQRTSLKEFGPDLASCRRTSLRPSDRSWTGSDFSLPRQMERHHLAHLQCTPSLASLIVRDAQALAALKRLRRLLVGGEALPRDLAHMLAGSISGELWNMYGRSIPKVSCIRSRPA